jgi:CheY-like chemotaxis protein
VHHILENCGYTVVEAESGIAAQQIWAEQGGRFDLLVTGIQASHWGWNGNTFG